MLQYNYFVVVEESQEEQELSKDGWTALMGACVGGHLEVAQYLVDRGVDIDATDNVSYNI